MHSIIIPILIFWIIICSIQSPTINWWNNQKKMVHLKNVRRLYIRSFVLQIKELFTLHLVVYFKFEWNVLHITKIKCLLNQIYHLYEKMFITIVSKKIANALCRVAEFEMRLLHSSAFKSLYSGNIGSSSNLKLPALPDITTREALL